MSTVTGFADMAEDLHDFGEGLEDCSGDEMVGVADAVAEETAESTADDASDFAPVDTGYLSNNIFAHPTPVEPGHRLVFSPVDYAKHVEYGTGAHIIEPTPETTYDEPVLHPGATASPFLRPALWKNRRTMHDVFEDEIEDLFRRQLR